ncbi:MAG TPA: hypothetical protein VGQ81_10660 [Acidobacteriota bacterium]|jgi:hypothetical protein|nr:hypothetical protein [Acidobacteriota bacterium]
MNKMQKLLPVVCFLLAAMFHGVFAQQSKSGAPSGKEAQESDIVRLAREAKFRAGAGKKYTNATLGQLQEARVSYTTQWEPPQVRPAGVEVQENPPPRAQVKIPATQKSPKESKQKVDKQDIDRKLSKRGMRILYLRRRVVRTRAGNSRRAQPVRTCGLFSETPAAVRR